MFQWQKVIKDFDRLGREDETVAAQALVSVTATKLGATNRQFGWLRSFFLPTAHKEWSRANERLDKIHQYQTALNQTGQSMTQQREEIQTIGDQLRRFSERAQALPGGDTNQVGPSTISTRPTSPIATQALQPFKPTPYTQKPSNQAPASTTSTHRTYIIAPHHQKPSKPDARNTGIRAWIRSLAAPILWPHPHPPTPSPQNTTIVNSTFTSLIISTTTTLTTLKNHTINLYNTHIHSYYTRTTRYIAGVRAHEEQLQQSRLASLHQNQVPLSPSTAISLKPTRQEIIQEVALQAGFKPGEEVPYPALWVEPWVRARVQARYERGPLHSGLKANAKLTFFTDRATKPIRSLTRGFTKLLNVEIIGLFWLSAFLVYSLLCVVRGQKPLSFSQLR
ncbi:MAG: hypothetical protein Q9173_000622 [Seirophora scorigena]